MVTIKGSVEVFCDSFIMCIVTLDIYLAITTKILNLFHMMCPWGIIILSVWKTILSKQINSYSHVKIHKTNLSDTGVCVQNSS